MVQYFPVVTGSLTVTGSINVSGGITASGGISISGSIASASFASTASFVALAQSASNAVAASTASFANTLTVAGNLTAQTLVVQTITSSVDFVTGSTRFGSLLANTHVFSGSVTMNPGGLFVTSSGLVGIGTTNPANFLHINGLNPNLIIQNTTSSVGSESNLTFRSTFGDGNIAYLGYIRAIQQSTTQNTGDIAIHAYSTGSANEIIRIKGNSGYVGIGTTSPSYNLDVTGTGRFTGALTASSITTSAYSYLYGLRISGNDTGNTIYAGSANMGITAESGYNISIGRVSDTTKALNINTTNGNVGLGTAASAWQSPFIVIQGGSYGQHIGFQTNGPDIKIGTNNYYNGSGYIYTVSSNGAAQLNIGGNSGLQFNIAGSGTAGNAITFSTPFSITSAGVITAPYIMGKYFDMTSGAGTGTAITDTGIYVGSGDWGGFGRSTVYLVTFSANPNNGGSGEYSASHVGYINVYTGWSGSNVTTYIGYTQLAVGNNISTLTLYPTFWNGSTESNAVTRASITGYQMRIKISGYNSSFTGANQALYITKILTSG